MAVVFLDHARVPVTQHPRHYHEIRALHNAVAGPAVPQAVVGDRWVDLCHLRSLQQAACLMRLPPPLTIGPWKHRVRWRTPDCDLLEELDRLIIKRYPPRLTTLRETSLELPSSWAVVSDVSIAELAVARSGQQSSAHQMAKVGLAGVAKAHHLLMLKEPFSAGVGALKRPNPPPGKIARDLPILKCSVKQSLQNREKPVSRCSASPDLVSIGWHKPVALRLPKPGPQPSRLLRKCLMPPPDPAGRQLGKFDIAQLRQDMRVNRALRFGVRLPMLSKPLQVEGGGVADSERPAHVLIPGCLSLLVPVQLAGGRLSPREVQDADAVRVGIVIGLSEPPELVCVPADVHSGAPGAIAASEPPITKVQPLLEQDEVWLASYRQPEPSRPGFEARMPDRPGHPLAPSAPCPSGVQYMWANVSGQARTRTQKIHGLSRQVIVRQYAPTTGLWLFKAVTRVRLPLGTPRLLKHLGAAIEGPAVERKPFSIAIHHRRVDPARTGQVEQIVDRVVARHPTLRKGTGKKVFQVQPNIQWNKGCALLWVLDHLDLGPEALPVYIGDDVTDEDAFRALEGRGIGIAVRDGARSTKAAYALRDPEDVRRFLDALSLFPETSAE